MEATDIVGWGASAILIATLMRQSYVLWTDENAKGVSKWLFVGQIAASVLFIVYSWMVGNWVFIVSNTLILLTALAGEAGLMWRKLSSTTMITWRTPALAMTRMSGYLAVSSCRPLVDGLHATACKPAPDEQAERGRNDEHG